MIVLAAVVLLAIVAAHLFEPYDWSRNAKGFIRSFHAPGFAVVALALVAILRRRGIGSRRYWYAAAAAMLAGAASELAQLLGGRDADFGDLISDAVGVATGLGLAAILDASMRYRLRGMRLALLGTGTAAALIASFWDSATSAHALWARRAALPSLATFAGGWERKLYEEAGGPTARPAVRPADWPVRTDDVVLWAASTGRWRTFVHLRPYPDWRGYGALSFVAAAADKQSYELSVEVWDTPPGPEHRRNRFSAPIEVTPAAQRFTVGFDAIAAAGSERAFDFEHVDIIIFSLRGDGRGTILLDDFRLEP